jgi:hypothetical protein
MKVQKLRRLEIERIREFQEALRATEFVRGNPRYLDGREHRGISKRR